MSKYKKIGGGSYGVYQKQKTDWFSIILGIVLMVVVLGAIARCAS